MAKTIRQYVPAYRADNGNVIAIGSTTVSAHFAEQEADELRSPEDRTPVFVAYRDLPMWTPVEGGGCICGHPEAVHGPLSPRRCVACVDCGALPQDDPPDGRVHEYRPCDCPGFEPDPDKEANE